MKRRFEKGFTLVELMVVMGIVAVLAAIIAGTTVLARKTATETANRTNAKTLEIALEAYYNATGSYCSGSTSVANTSIGCGALHNFTTIINNGYLGRFTPPVGSLKGECVNTGGSTGGGRIGNISSGTFTLQVTTASCLLSDGGVMETITH